MDDDDDDNNENTDDGNTSVPLTPPTIGARVSAMYQGAYRAGTVLTVNDRRGIFKVRFDEFPTPEFDYSFSYKSTAWSYLTTTPATPSSSSSTTAESTKGDSEPLFSIVRKFKALIKVKIFFPIF